MYEQICNYVYCLCDLKGVVEMKVDYKARENMSMVRLGFGGSCGILEG